MPAAHRGAVQRAAAARRAGFHAAPVGEVTPQLDIKAFTIANASERMQKLKRDPLRELLDLQPDISAALERLGKR